MHGAMAKRNKAVPPEPPENPWPARLSALRAKLGLTQVQLAARLRISQSQLSAYQSGSRKPTRPIAYLIELLENEQI
jgi:transcriptional regulator with XRE-family HTH domain